MAPRQQQQQPSANYEASIRNVVQTYAAIPLYVLYALACPAGFRMCLFVRVIYTRAFYLCSVHS